MSDVSVWNLMSTRGTGRSFCNSFIGESGRPEMLFNSFITCGAPPLVAKPGASATYGFPSMLALRNADCKPI